MSLWKKPPILTSATLVNFVVLFIYGLVFFHSQNLFAATCTETATDAASIQTLVDSASPGDVICVPAGTYQLNITLTEGVMLQGLELAMTFLESESDTSPVISGAIDSIVQNLTIQGSGIGISAVRITNFTVRNVVISSTTTGIDADNSTITVSNVVLDENSTAITCQNNSDLTLNNSVISNSTTTDLNLSSTTLTSNNNLLYNNQTANYPTGDVTSVFEVPPLFVDSANNDYHLQTESPAIDAGIGTDPDTTTADIGGYGGDNADVTPFPVAGLNITATGLNSVTLTWDSNDAYNISSYKVYFDTDTSGETYDGIAAEGNSPVRTTSLTQQLTSLVTQLTTLTAPTGLITVPGNETILVSWESVPDASGYQVSYGTSSGNYTTTVDIGNAAMYQISDLANDETIFIAVNAYSKPTVYLAVAAEDLNNNESARNTEVSSVLSNTINPGSISNELSDFPEASVMFPNLNDEYNCFIATAAYGSSLEPQVVMLRKFRNHFLLTNSLGRHFVALYYKLSPKAASFINEYDWLKPITQAILYPVIGVAWFCLKLGSALNLGSFLLVFALFMTLRRYSRMKKCV
jgi:hypothetical protein